jgi:hypothetical protein
VPCLPRWLPLAVLRRRRYRVPPHPHLPRAPAAGVAVIVAAIEDDQVVVAPGPPRRNQGKARRPARVDHRRPRLGGPRRNDRAETTAGPGHELVTCRLAVRAALLRSWRRDDEITKRLGWGRIAERLHAIPVS